MSEPQRVHEVNWPNGESYSSPVWIGAQGIVAISPNGNVSNTVVALLGAKGQRSDTPATNDYKEILDAAGQSIPLTIDSTGVTAVPELLRSALRGFGWVRIAGQGSQSGAGAVMTLYTPSD